MIYRVKLKELREEKNLKIQDISKFLELEKDTYGKFEREYQTIPCLHLNTLCNFFNVSFDYIFGFANIRKYNNSKGEIDYKLAGQRLKSFRKEQKITQQELAKFLGTVQPTITYYESGRNIISTLYLYNICRKYKISADYLLGKIDEPKYLD